MMKIIVVFILMVNIPSQIFGLPETSKVCTKSEYNTTECKEVVAATIKTWADGNQALNLQSLDPFYADHFEIEKSESQTLVQDYKNVEISGLLKNMEISGWDVDFNNLIFKVDFLSPEVEFAGDYHLDGKARGFNVQGDGTCKFTMDHLLTKVTANIELFNKDGKEYIRITKWETTLNLQKIMMDFDNLFDGDWWLSGPANYFIRQYSNELFEEMRGGFEMTLNKIFIRIANNVFSNIPVE